MRVFLRSRLFGVVDFKFQAGWNAKNKKTRSRARPGSAWSTIS